MRNHFWFLVYKSRALEAVHQHNYLVAPFSWQNSEYNFSCTIQRNLMWICIHFFYCSKNTCLETMRSWSPGLEASGRFVSNFTIFGPSSCRGADPVEPYLVTCIWLANLSLKCSLTKFFFPTLITFHYTSIYR